MSAMHEVQAAHGLAARRRLMPLFLVALAGCYGAMAVSMLPSLVNSWIVYRGIESGTAGLIAMGNILGATAALALSTLLVKRLDLVKIMAAGLVIAAVCDLASMAADGVALLAALRVACGFGLGLMVAATTNWIGRDDQADRGFGIYVTLQFVLAAVLLVLASRLEPVLGYAAVYTALLSLGAITLLILPVLARLPGGDPVAAPVLDRERRIGGAPWNIVALSLATMVLFNTAAVGLWAYMLNFGVAVGLTVDDAAMLLALSSLCGIPGGFLVLLIGVRFGRLAPILTALAAFIATLLVFAAGVATALAFIAGLVFQNIAWNFVYPYFQGLQSALDPTGRLPVWGILCASLGSAAGPALLGALVDGANYADAFWLAAALLAASGAAAIMPALHAHRVGS